MIIFNDKEKKDLLNVIGLIKPREKLRRVGETNTPKFKDTTANLLNFLESLDNDRIHFLLVVREIGRSPDEYQHEIYRERFMACDKSTKSVGLSKQDAISILMQTQSDKFLLVGVRNLGNTFEY